MGKIGYIRVSTREQNEDRQVIAMTRRFLDQLVTARTALLELVYNGDSVIVNERIEQMYKEYAIMLCGK